MDGSTGEVTTSGAALTGSNTFTTQTWFKTTTTTGGVLTSFADVATGKPTWYDRFVFMNNSGQLVFGVYPDAFKTVTSPKAYNDGAWHLVTATLSSAGMQLYVDGARVAVDANTTTAQVYNGSWRIGYSNLDTWSGTPSSYRFKGQLDETAVWNTVALSASQIQAAYTNGH